MGKGERIRVAQLRIEIVNLFRLVWVASMYI